jgi:hypothetical protein
MCIAEVMVALDEVVEVWTQSQFARLRHHPFRFQLLESCTHYRRLAASSSYEKKGEVKKHSVVLRVSPLLSETGTTLFTRERLYLTSTTTVEAK